MVSGFAKFVTADGCERIEEAQEITHEKYRICLWPMRLFGEDDPTATPQVFGRRYKLMGRLSGNVYEYREVLEVKKL